MVQLSRILLTYTFFNLFARTRPNPNNPIEVKEANIWCEYYQDFIPSSESCMEPMSYYYYPIISNINNTRQYYFDIKLTIIS